MITGKDMEKEMVMDKLDFQTNSLAKDVSKGQ